MKIIDMHLHLTNRSPCSRLNLKEIEQHLSPQIEGICVTDHQFNLPIQNKGWSKAIFVGAELEVQIETDKGRLGHMLVFGASELPPPSFGVKDTIDFIHQQGGICICAHPYGKEFNSFFDEIFQFQFDAIEINGRLAHKENNLARDAAKTMGIPLIGGSDAHQISHLNTVATSFAQNVKTLPEIIEAIKQKQVSVQWFTKEKK